MNDDKPFLPGESWKFRLKDGMNWGGLVLTCDSSFVQLRDTMTGKTVKIAVSEISFSVKMAGADWPNKGV